MTSRRVPLLFGRIIGVHKIGVRTFSLPSLSNSIAYNVNVLQPAIQNICHTRYCSSFTNDPIFNIETEEEFDEKVTNSERPVLVDFYADWCGPCKILGPILESKVSNRDGQIFLAKVDVDSAESLPERFQIRAVPTVLAIKNGEIVNRFEGVVDDEKLEEFIEDLIERE